MSRSVAKKPADMQNIICRLFLPMASLAFAAGCATIGLQVKQQNLGAVTLPLSQSGIVDRRQEFSDLFESKLSPQFRQSDKAWLHLDSHKQSETQKNVSLTPKGVSVLVVPGILGECVDKQALPFGDGVVRTRDENYTAAYEKYSNLGRVRAIHVAGRGSSIHNARIIAEEIRAESALDGVADVILVAYSKGAADSMVALEEINQQGGNSKVRALVSVSGVILGTPIADKLRDLYRLLGDELAPFGCPNSIGGEVDSLTIGERLAWLNAHKIPTSIALYSVVAHTARASISPGLAPFFDVLSILDPLNDGQVVAASAILPKAHLLAEVNSDHWTYVLPLEKHPSAAVRAISSKTNFPREEFFRSMVELVASDIEKRKTPDSGSAYSEPLEQTRQAASR